MSYRHYALTAGTPSTVRADYADRGHVPASRRVDRTAAKAAVRKRRLSGQRHSVPENDIRLKERERIAHQLHDTLFQGFLGASMLLSHAVELIPAESPSKSAVSRALRLVRRVIDDGRSAVRGMQIPSPVPSSLEQALTELLREFTNGTDRRLRIFVQGKPRTLNPVIQEQIFLISREAVMNALRHSQASRIDVEVQYLRRLLRVLVTDNGCGIGDEALHSQGGSHWGLRGMYERAERIGARVSIRSRACMGTEVRIEHAEV